MLLFSVFFFSSYFKGSFENFSSSRSSSGDEFP